MSNANPSVEAFDFAEFFAEFGKGAPNRVMTERLQEIVQACQQTGQKGAIAIKFSVGVIGGVAELRCKISHSKPEAALPGGIYFSTDDGALVEEDPRQLKLPSKIIDIQPVKNINNSNQNG